jgi:hypothetical protein
MVKQEWIGSATELLADMENLAAKMKVNTKSRAWPKGPQILIRRLNEVKATLEEVKIFITRGLDNKSKIKTVEIRKRPLLSLPPLQDEKCAQITSGSSNDTGNDAVTPTKVSLPKEGQNRAQIEEYLRFIGVYDKLIEELFEKSNRHYFIGPRGNRNSDFRLYLIDKMKPNEPVLFEYSGQEDLDYTIWTEDSVLVFEAKQFISSSGGLDLNWEVGTKE